MSDEEAVRNWCRFVRLVTQMDEKEIEIISALVDVAKASRGGVPVPKFTPVRKLGTGPLLETGN